MIAAGPSTARAPVAFIGLGAMGAPMASCLLRKGWALRVHDARPAAVAALASENCSSAATPGAAAQGVGTTLCMVSTTEQLRAVLNGEGGILSTPLTPGHRVVVMSTVDPVAFRGMTTQAAAAGVTLIDAPVSGGVTGARDGTLTVMIGGEAEAVANCGDIFSAIARHVFHVGPTGAGLAMKLVNNLLIQTNIVVLCEALVLGVKAGLDPGVIRDVVNASTGRSFVFQTRVPRILARDFVSEGTVDISCKDQDLQLAFAEQLGVPLLMTNTSRHLFRLAQANGLGRSDAAAVIQVIERLADVVVEAQST